MMHLRGSSIKARDIWEVLSGVPLNSSCLWFIYLLLFITPISSLVFYVPQESVLYVFYSLMIFV